MLTFLERLSATVIMYEDPSEEGGRLQYSMLNFLHFQRCPSIHSSLAFPAFITMFRRFQDGTRPHNFPYLISCTAGVHNSSDNLSATLKSHVHQKLLA